MKLVLSSGTTISISNFKEGKSLVNGTQVPSITLTVKNESLENVKNIFNNPDNLTQVNIYDDKNTLLSNVSGYTKRVNITLGEKDDVYEVTIAQSSDAMERIAAIEDRLVSIAEICEKNRKDNEIITKNLMDFGAAVGIFESKLSSMSTGFTQCSSGLAQVSELITQFQSQTEENTASNREFSKAVIAIKDSFEKGMERVNSISSQYEAIGSAFESVKSVKSDIDKAIRATNELASVRQEYRELNESMKKMNAIIRSANDSVKITQENAISAKKDVDAFMENDAAAMQEIVENGKKSIADFGRKINVFTDDVETIGRQVNEVSDKLATVSEGRLGDRKLLNNLNEDMRERTADINRIKKSSADTGKTIEEIDTKINDTIEKMTNHVKDLDNLKTSNTEQMENLNQMDQTLKEAMNAADNLKSRVSALEPITDYKVLPLDDAKAYRVKESSQLLEDFLAANPIKSAVHKKTSYGYYSITKEKQQLLQAMILLTTMYRTAGFEYQPSWNEAGEKCDYTWTLEELQQLSMEMELRIRPLVSYQQTIEKTIKETKSMEELEAIEIDYSSVEEVPLTLTPIDGSEVVVDEVPESTEE